MKLTKDFDTGSEFSTALFKHYAEQEEADNRLRHKLFRNVLSRYAPNATTTNTGSYTCAGYRKLDLIYRHLNTLYRSPQQKEFHDAFIASILRIIFGDDYNRERHNVMAKYGFESKKQQVLVCAPRRMGKTWSVAFLMVVVSIVLSGQEISIFSPGRRQSVALMNHIYNFVKKLDETSRVIRRNEEKLIMRCVDGGESTINAYPSAVQTLKGVSGTIVVLEEMAVIDPRVLFEVVVPLHQIDITSIIGISTITDEYNFMTKYLERKDPHGELLFAVKRIFLACDACKEAGKAAQCNHNAYLLPNWSSPRKRRIINCIMQGQEDLLAREIGGVASSAHKRAFSLAYVDRIFDSPRYTVDVRVSFPEVFIAIDPNGCGRNSDFAITTILRYKGDFVIIGLESFASKTARENHRLVLSHVARLEKVPVFRNSLKVFILENNLALEAEHISTMLRHEAIGTDYLVMTEKDKGDKVGFNTSHKSKALGVEFVRDKLEHNKIKVLPESQLVSVSMGGAQAFETLREQMKEFSEVVKEREMGKPRKFYHGKAAGKDDLIITFILALYWSGYFYSEYRKFMRQPHLER